ncbi:unnamed protein product [Bemisia tabaci]|uniref:Thioredoxin domain-containing protein 9 n=1 Tax=Bemisia tabaci TaxID=7038 RepID=A0A9P0AGG6_BEMTA|nr:PREDICTED: thioredoxin domain-containing protein 9 [Bemisia tabaci]CAH0390664.1 unnamed protein product [Bemisia tabaci]
MSAVENVLQQHVLQVASAVEEQLDAEIQQLDELDSDGIEKLREQRLKQMRNEAKARQEWLAKGHGDYEELAEEKEFFGLVKQSPNMVVHFYKDGSPRCKIVDHHLKILAKKHLECRFCKINVERAPFLTERLRIKMIPTLALVKDGITKDYIVGFTDLGNCDDFSTEMLEWRIAQSFAIDYKGDLMNPPDQRKMKKTRLVPKTIRGKEHDDDEDDINDW